MSPNAHAICKPSQQAFVLLAAHVVLLSLLVFGSRSVRQAKSKDLEGVLDQEMSRPWESLV